MGACSSKELHPNSTGAPARSPSSQQQQQEQQTGPANPESAQQADLGTTTTSSDAVQNASVLISPATSNRNLKFDRTFRKVFTAFSLRHAFKDHPAFHAVFEKRGGGIGHGWPDSAQDWGGEAPGLKKFPGKIVALSEDLAAAGGGAGRSVYNSAATAAAAGGNFALTSASKGLVSAIMTAYSRYD